MRKNGIKQGSQTWRPIALGGGGYITGVDIALDGTIISWTDVNGGAFMWDAVAKVQRPIIRSNNLPANFEDGTPAYDEYAGPFACAISKTNSSRIYASHRSRIITTANKAGSWTECAGVPAMKMFGNGPESKHHHPKMLVDPGNPSVLYLGTPENGFHLITGAGATSQQATGIPLPDVTAGNYPHGREKWKMASIVVAIDPTSALVNAGTANERRSVVYAGSYGQGVFKSTDGGVSFTAINSTSAPLYVTYMVCDQNGVLWACDHAAAQGTGLRKFAANAWTVPAIGQVRGAYQVVVNPADANHIYVHADDAYGAAEAAVSYDGGTTFLMQTGSTRLAPNDGTWKEGAGFISPGRTMFDPSRTTSIANNKAIQSDGIGIYETTLPAQAQWGGVTWTSMTKGIENLVANSFCSVPDGPTFAVCWDRPIWNLDRNLDEYPSSYEPDGIFNHCWDVDYSRNNPNALYALLNWFGNDNDWSCLSKDGGKSWSRFAARPAEPGLGGCMAVSNEGNIVWIPARNRPPVFSKDDGASWQLCQIPNLPPFTNQSDYGFSNDYYFKRHIVAADKTQPDTFYLFWIGVFYGDTSTGGVFKSTDGGHNWTRVYAGYPAPWPYYHANLRATPGHTGHLWWTSGFDQGEPLKRSFNGADTWQNVNGPNGLPFTRVTDVAFGKNRRGATYPALLVYGTNGGVTDLFVSEDNGATWTAQGIAAAVANMSCSIDSVSSLGGNMNRYGEYYLGYGGNSAIRGFYNCPRTLT